jgi:Mannosyl-glycoprotein endo-beta-N-acetylglucosaminidase/N-acetylmuramoyl-L-alanine amidase
MPHRVMVQAGHFPPLQPGHEGQTGAPGERELVREIQLALAKILDGDPRFKPVPVPGRIPPGARVDAALFLHADGAASPAATGFSFGYPDYPVNKHLAELIADEFLRIPGHPVRRGDNYTRDEHYYYGFHHVDTPGPEVLVEHGFTTNPREHAWLTAHIGVLAQAEYRALLRYFGHDQQPGGNTAVQVRAATARAGAVRAAKTRSDAHLRSGADQSTRDLGLVTGGTDVAITGSNGDWRRVRVAGWMHKSLLQEAAHQGGGGTQGGQGQGQGATTIGLETTLLSAARTSPEQVEQYMVPRQHGAYSDDDVRQIVRLYFETASAVGLDPLLVLSQLTLETGNLSSFWSQVPRRNPAGIGVTGAQGEGLSFPDWPTAVRAHVGRLLAYAIPPGTENPTQSHLIEEALAFRPLPQVYRGSVRKLGDLGHGVWAADPDYRHKLVHMANAIRGHAA